MSKNTWNAPAHVKRYWKEPMARRSKLKDVKKSEPLSLEKFRGIK
jgi:hypothetical protein